MTIPTKTTLGQEELRSRAQRLGQRHRTVLLLIDGRRELAEVLHLAHQAGAATSHFEDLVKLGLVDLPEPPAPPPAPEIVLPVLTSVEVAAPALLEAIEPPDVPARSLQPSRSLRASSRA